MSDLSKHVYTEGNNFYFDAEVYTEDGPVEHLDYEDGDMIKWTWENQKMAGVLREENPKLGLFIIENVAIYK